MNYHDSNNTTRKYWLRLWSIIQTMLAPFLFIVALITRREMHSTSYLLSLLRSKWYHWRCELPAGQFIFTLYLGIIFTGTVLLMLSRYEDWYFGPTNLEEQLKLQLDRWLLANQLDTNETTSFGDFISICFTNLMLELRSFVYEVKLGPINMHNFNLLVDALFTATSATCLTGMTTTDITQYPPLVIISLVLAGAASLTIFAISFNINSFFYSESTSRGVLRLEEYSEGRQIGKFTLKAMYGFVMLGILSLTFYFLPPSLVTQFLRSEFLKAINSIQENFIYIFVWSVPFALAGLLVYKLWDKIQHHVNSFLKQDSVYYTTVTAFTISIIFWLYYAEGHWELMDFFRSLGKSIFLAISAFTNAGFDTYHGDLNLRLGSQHASQVLTVIIMLLIFFGSLGMQVVRDLPHVFYEIYLAITSKRFSLKRLGMKISFNTKLILITNIVLWISGGLMLWFLESTKGGSLAGLTSAETFFTTAFQAINMRTAGFSIRADVSMYSHPTLLLIMMMMLIGGSPNSMSGGMKVSTVAILFLVAKSLLDRRDGVYAFGEEISEETIRKAMTTFVLTISSLALALMLIFSFYDGLQEDYFKVAFDVVGAFTTIGLNTGISDWNIPCKLVLIVCMCFGKIGVLTIGMSMRSRNSKNRGIKK
ncbi:MAG: hypothetical protein MJ050_05230 [Phascolarctobacterium sp.]|nr:hypothetical protein [Phascolarctobacterium sp.]